MSEEITFPVAETFYSIQGEGLYAGTPMFFIRLAGCNVGKPFARLPKSYSDKVAISHEEAFQVLQPEHTTCTSYSGTQFVCDTDYRVKEKMTIQDLLNQLPDDCRHVSITGGEPLIHKQLTLLIQSIINCGIMVNLETSGTIDLYDIHLPNFDITKLWITCSPKHGYIDTNADYIDQYKFLVETDLDVEIIEKMEIEDTPIFIQPIEHYDANGPIKSSYDFVVDVVKKHPTWRLSLQLHKIMGVR